MLYETTLTPFDIEITYFAVCISAFVSVTYLFCKSFNIKPQKYQWLYLVITGLGLSVFYTYLMHFEEQLPHLIMYFSIPLFVAFLKRNDALKSIAIAFISLGLFSVIKILATLITGTVFYYIGFTQKVLPAELINIGVSVCLSILFMQIKRFKGGFQFFQEEHYIGLGLAISGIIIMVSCISIEQYIGYTVIYLVVIGSALISGFGLYLWIRRSITAHYRERLQLKSEEHYRQMLLECEKEQEKLKQTNDFLAKIVHRDNHLMSALNTSINTYFEIGDSTEKDILLREIQTMTKERGALIEKEQRRSKILPSTGNLLIDGAINDLYLKAAAHGIDFDLTVSETVDEIIGKYLSQTELQTLLCDHIKDAVIAVETKGEKRGKILVEFLMKKGSYHIVIFDSGVDFETDTLKKLGKQRVTTHADNGGSGIGFITTFETLRKARASLMITEFEHKTPFSKSVAFCFDGEGAFVIRSYRSETLKAALNREEVLLINN